LWYLITGEEMTEIIANAPQVGRILRPLCHILGTELPEGLKLPKRTRVRKQSTLPRLSDEDEERLRRMTARFPDTPPARSAKRALRRMLARLPVNLDRMSAIARGYFFHPPRDGNCPPPPGRKSVIDGPEQARHDAKKRKKRSE
jgi:hypothetical protein